VPILYFGLDYFSLIEEQELSIDKIPTVMNLTMSILFCLIIEDCLFYFMHRLLHYPPIYPYFHKIHHQFKTTTSMAGQHQHPVEFILTGLFPSAVGPALLGPQTHMLTVLAWYFYRTCESIDGHCGYSFPWAPLRLLPFSAGDAFHDYHHAENVGNYGS